MDQTLERWRPVAGLEDRYEVSDHGRVRSLPRVTMRGNVPQRVRGKVIAQRTMEFGHKQVTLITSGGRIHPPVHRLVAGAFCTKPDGCDIVNHLDSNPANNHWTNLEWTTTAGNQRHMWASKRGWVPVLQGSRHPKALHTEKDVQAVRQLLSSGKTHAQIAAELFVSKSFVSEVSSGRQWRHCS